MPLHKSATYKTTLLLAMALVVPLTSYSQNIQLPPPEIFPTYLRSAGPELPNPFLASFYKPTYALPLYYTGSPYDAVYYHDTPDDQSIDQYDIKFQFSLKVPLWQRILHRPSTLYLAYTQVSYWQAYNHSAFFRETDYEPELFLANEIHLPRFLGWKMDFLNFGAIHQSNGRGGDMERGWNRIYMETVFSHGNLILSIKPWYIIHDTTLHDYNPDIGRYLGYERVLLSYKFKNQVLSFEARNTVESGFKRGAMELTWSIPLTHYFSGYVQVFSGYGQSLIEYNHFTNSVGVGIAFSNWL